MTTHNEVSVDSICADDDGCPTEMAVLKRFWRNNKDSVDRYLWLRDRLAVEDIEQLVRDFWGAPDEEESKKTDAAIDAARKAK